MVYIFFKWMVNLLKVVYFNGGERSKEKQINKKTIFTLTGISCENEFMN